VLVHHSVRPVQIDSFGSDVERSVKGAVYFWSNSVKEITEAELEHIKVKHPWLAAKLAPVKVEVKKPVQATPEPEKPRKPEPERRSYRSSRKKSKDEEGED